MGWTGHKNHQQTDWGKGVRGEGFAKSTYWWEVLAWAGEDTSLLTWFGTWADMRGEFRLFPPGVLQQSILGFWCLKVVERCSLLDCFCQNTAQRPAWLPVWASRPLTWFHLTLWNKELVAFSTELLALHQFTTNWRKFLGTMKQGISWGFFKFRTYSSRLNSCFQMFCCSREFLNLFASLDFL